MTTIYLVRSETGEYSDWSVRFVCAYMDKEVANKHAKLAQEEGTRIFKTHYGKDTWYKSLDERPKNKYDPGMYIDYTGVSYDVEAIELRDANDLEAIE